VRAALVVIRLTTDHGANLEAALDGLARAARAHARLALLPEAAFTGLANNDDPEHDLPLGQPIPGRFTDRLSSAARHHSMYIATGLLERDADHLYDAAVLVDPSGEILLHYRRINAMWHGRQADPEVYRQGTRLTTVDTVLGRIAILICGDLFDAGVLDKVRAERPDLVLVPMSRNFADGTFDQRRWDREEEPQYAARAALTGATTLIVNALEDPTCLDFPSFGGAMAVAPDGRITARWPLGGPGILMADVPRA